MTTHPLRLLLLAVLLLPAAVSPAPAAAPVAVAAGQPDAAPPALVADGGVSLVKWLSGGRTRVVQVCVVAMCLALFIMMRKLT